MSSILTNNGAMVALQTLKSINANLNKTQDEISTGKSVSTAKDNAAVWAISKVMEAEVSGFKAISSGLSLGASAVATARNGAEAITDLLTQMRDKIVTAQGVATDRDKLQNDVIALRDQITTVIKGAQFKGLNLLDGSAGASIDVLSSLDRSANGVTASSITVNSQNLSIGQYTANAVFGASTGGVSAAGDTAGFFLDAGASNTIEIDAGAIFAAGDSISVTIGGKTASYTFSATDVAATTPSDLGAVGLKNAIEKLGIAGLEIDFDSGTPGTLTLTNNGTDDLSVTAQYRNAGAGALGQLANINVSTAAGATTALNDIEAMLQASISAAADFGSAGKRLETQSNFLSKLTDSLTSGIGAMVDADMEATSARLQALQTQQQLGIQSLSIANQAPQAILSLFRG
ncbi:flagellin [Paracoccus aminophilus]|uniref:Flagellin n=1 Tax=Paracoccus aminophilus JCM 7686 TaxID=1367847 RepID=S5Y0I8_PARAH|nr:flagellin [Paracoccus aminophilus]AGT09245.1 flagellin protein [Paracoccus aminophilus JCM 7686]